MSNFSALGLSEPILKGILDLGFETPTPVQEKAIPILLKDKTDLVALAQTGTGKTAAFGLPLLSVLDFSNKDTQSLILCPTRELCMQITRDLGTFAKYLKTPRIIAVYGGASIEAQIRDLKTGAHIIVATPGRLVDLINRKKINLQTVTNLVLDEADEMLNMGFKDDLDFILSHTPAEKNTWLFSATMEDEVARIARTYMKNPVEVTLGSKNQGNENIEHIYYVVNARDKYAALKRIVDFYPDIYAIVFCRTRIETQEIVDMMIKDGYSADALHGDLSQAQRDYVMKRYRSRSIKLLVATDVAARGIDVTDVTHVIHYNLPDEPGNYTHRSGRTARAGKTGVSIAIITKADLRKIRPIERIIKSTFTKGEIPSGEEICQQQILQFVKEVNDSGNTNTLIEKYIPEILAEFKNVSKEDIIQRFLSKEFQRLLQFYQKNSHDLNVYEDQRGGERDTHRSGGLRLFMNLGDRDGLNKGDMVRLLIDKARIESRDILDIFLNSNFSFITVTAPAANQVIKAFDGLRIGTHTVRVEVEGGKREPRSGGPGARSSSSGPRSGGFRSGKPSFRSKGEGFRGKKVKYEF
jgi:ATP-dependent RNA helicase DeaD